MIARTRYLIGGLIAAFALVSQPYPGVAQNDVPAVITNWVEAVGGMENYDRFRSATFTFTTEIYDPDSGRLRRTRPRYVWIKRTAAGLFSRIERWEGDDFIAQGWHPGGQWATLNGEALSEGHREYDQADYVGGDVNYWIGLPWKLLDPGVNLDSEGVDAEGREVIRVTFGDNVGESQDTWRYYFADGQTWPVLTEYTTEGGTRPSPNAWTDIQVVDGFYYVGQRVHYNADGKVRMIVRRTDFVMNPELDDSVFTKP